jgi:hypothetical protein
MHSSVDGLVVLFLPLIYCEECCNEHFVYKFLFEPVFSSVGNRICDSVFNLWKNWQILTAALHVPSLSLLERVGKLLPLPMILGSHFGESSGS